jgi:hypothetical protein
MQVLSGSLSAIQLEVPENNTFLSPKLKLSDSTLQQAVDNYSKAKVKKALKSTAEGIDKIGQLNFERELSPREMVVALAMILEGKSLRQINEYFDSLNYVLEEAGIKKKPKQIIRIRIVRTISIFFFAVSFGLGFTMLDIIGDKYHVGHIITMPIFLFVAWFLIGWMVDFFFWIEKKIDPKNKYTFDKPLKSLSEQEKKEYLKEIEKTMRNVINERFDEHDRQPGNNAAKAIKDIVLKNVKPMRPMQSVTVQSLFNAI